MHGLVAQQPFLPNPDESYFLSLLSSPTFCIPDQPPFLSTFPPPPQQAPPTPPAEVLPSTTTKPKSKKKAPLPYASNLLNLCFNAPSSSSENAPKKPKKKPLERKPRPVTKKTINHPPRYQCDFDGCNKVFTRPYNLKSHKRTHTAERPFACQYCHKRFARQHDRNRHAKLHTGIKAYVCKHCNKAFARQDALSRHQRPSGQGLCCSNSANNNNSFSF
ncbi:hypothetical protein BJV82DRAFT_585273 [Fennellomyces sp. T-0311]|nr:hypothetical protein BJV82DRAFT_585273 [Fennellomyces sp. T-0311]